VFNVYLLRTVIAYILCH